MNRFAAISTSLLFHSNTVSLTLTFTHSFASTQLSKSETDGSLTFNERIVGVLVFSSHKSASREVNALCDKLEGKSWGKFGELVLDLKDKMLMA